MPRGGRCSYERRHRAKAPDRAHVVGQPLRVGVGHVPRPLVVLAHRGDLAHRVVLLSAHDRLHCVVIASLPPHGGRVADAEEAAEAGDLPRPEREGLARLSPGDKGIDPHHLHALVFDDHEAMPVQDQVVDLDDLPPLVRRTPWSTWTVGLCPKARRK